MLSQILVPETILAAWDAVIAEKEAANDSRSAVDLSNRALATLAAGEFETAEQLAKLMGGRPTLEAKHDHPFDYCLGYTLKAFVLRTPHETEEWAVKFTAMCRKSDNVDFAGYAEVLHGILAHDVRMAQGGLLAVIQGHKKQSKRGGVFNGLEDEALCVWGVGIANLTRHSGLAINGVSPLIPQELLI